MQNLTKKTYFAYALHAYNNPSCGGMEEFQEDLVRLKYIRRLLHRYVKTNDVSVRLLLNHLVGVYNVFTPDTVARLLFYRTDPEAWSALKTVLEYTNLMPAEIPPVEGVTILNTSIPRDTVLWGLLTETVEGHATTR